MPVARLPSVVPMIKTAADFEFVWCLGLHPHLMLLTFKKKNKKKQRAIPQRTTSNLTGISNWSQVSLFYEVTWTKQAKTVLHTTCSQLADRSVVVLRRLKKSLFVGVFQVFTGTPQEPRQKWWELAIIARSVPFHTARWSQKHFSVSSTVNKLVTPLWL